MNTNKFISTHDNKMHWILLARKMNTEMNQDKVFRASYMFNES